MQDISIQAVAGGFLLYRGVLINMKIKYLSALLATGAMALATPAIANSPNEPSLNFSCQINEGIPTTVAKSTESEVELPIFHWKQEALAYKTEASPDQLCNMVSEKLENYSTQGYDLSNINFVGTEQGGLPVICANAGQTDCSKILLTLHPTSESEPANVARDVVDSILDKNLQLKKSEYKTRGVQSISYQVDVWSLLGLRPKFLGK